jgi:hypothetical protein
MGTKVRSGEALAIGLPRLHQQKMRIPENLPAFHRSQHYSGMSSQVERNVLGFYECINSAFFFSRISNSNPRPALASGFGSGSLMSKCSLFLTGAR